MKNDHQGVYWLTVVGRANGHVYVEAEPGYKPCKRPGTYIARQFADGLCCPGCERRCHIPATAGVAHDDRIVALEKVDVSPPPCIGLSVCGGGCTTCPAALGRTLQEDR